MSNADQGGVAIWQHNMFLIFALRIAYFVFLHHLLCSLHFCIFVDEYGVEQGCYISGENTSDNPDSFCILYFAFCIFVFLLMNMALLSGENTCDNPES